jgi:DNA-directed RNA polymerase specialized sigma24 family protein
MEERYEHLRFKLVTFFKWRRCENPEEFADETITRVIKRISTGKEINVNTPYASVYVVANFVFKEHFRNARKMDTIAGDWSASETARESDCRRECLQKLSHDKLELLLAYYSGKESTETMAQLMGVSVSGLRKRIHRIRTELRSCFKDCLKGI